ncbi:hypothetical protein [Micromonospora sp. KC721]|uniref:hypothetical protein n=1 Tax=Micromonospora sp. KC721 TaxID=2530380 RepID=UPI00105069EE|nr:hypothetical protein [Micromonospora sp. KC721]TDB78882.1 hypothetical protein E1182_14580 [Micromonospora sp. KC721]
MTTEPWRLPSRAWQVVFASLVFAAVVAVSSMVYANSVARTSERSLCDLVVRLDDTYRTMPPQTATGRQLAAEIAELRKKLGCPASRALRG